MFDIFLTHKKNNTRFIFISHPEIVIFIFYEYTIMYFPHCIDKQTQFRKMKKSKKKVVATFITSDGQGRL